MVTKRSERAIRARGHGEQRSAVVPATNGVALSYVYGECSASQL